MISIARKSSLLTIEDDEVYPENSEWITRWIKGGIVRESWKIKGKSGDEQCKEREREKENNNGTKEDGLFLHS